VAAIIPTKGNLLSTKKSLALARLGFELLDRKRNILLREIMQLCDEAEKLRAEIDDTYTQAYTALQNANLTIGICDEIAKAVPVERGLELDARSVMGVELPILRLNASPPALHYGLSATSSQLDRAYICFDNVKRQTVRLAEMENSIYRLATAIRKTGRRANALKNIIIPRNEAAVKYITDALDEKEREDYSRLKVIRKRKSEE